MSGQSVSVSRGKPPAVAANAAPILVGFTAVIGQIVLMRELIVLFGGNEISTGIALTAWLMWTAVGSGAAGRLRWSRPHPRRAVAALQCLSAVSLAPTVWMLRAGRAAFQSVPGELIGPLPMLVTALLSLSSFCVFSGALFVAAARMYQQECDVSECAAVSYAYLLEAVGSGLGGLLSSLLLLRFLGSFQIAVVLAFANIGAAAILFFRVRGWKVAVPVVAAALSAVPLVAWTAPCLDRSAQQRLWQEYRIVQSRSTIYGSITVVATGDLQTIYDNGVRLASIPDQASAEEAVHYALLESPAPGTVLLIGGGAGGSLQQALQHPSIRRLDYVELDPALVGISRQISPALSSALSDARVRVHFADARLWLKTTPERFDAIVVDLPDPETAQLNRFYTEEFFRSARDHLATNGILAFQVRSSEETISPELAEFLRCINRTVLQVFPYVAIMPGETLHFFAAGRPNVLTEDPRVLIARLRSRRLRTQYVREYLIPFRMMPDRMAQVRKSLQPLPATPLNRDFHPIAYYFNAVLWSAQFRSRVSTAFKAAARLSFPLLLGSVMILLLAALLVVRLSGRKRPDRAAARACAALSGYTLMALEILLLFSFQSVYGYVYHELAVLIGLFLAGTGLGSWLGIRRMGAATPATQIRAVAVTQFLLAFSAPVLLLVVALLAAHADTRSTLWSAQLVFPALALFCGIPGGFQFSLTSEICLRTDGGPAGTGTIYALDLLGGSIGALLLSGYLIPVFGFWSAAWFTAAATLAPALLTAWAVLDTRIAALQMGGSR